MDIRDLPDGIAVSVRVQPRASHNQVAGVIDNCLKLHLTSPPVDGEANQACIEFLAHLLRLPKKQVSLLTGQKSRKKVIKIQGITSAQFLEAVQGNDDKN